VLLRSAALLIALAINACARAPVPVASGSADAPCATAGLKLVQGLDPGVRLAAAFISNRADIASWESTGYGSGSLRVVISSSPSSSASPLARVDACYYEGAFNIGGHPLIPVGGPTFRPYDILLVLVSADGGASIARTGFRDTMPLASPPHGP
jgi:hypothetical protein